jgi:hypothetical protein
VQFIFADHLAFNVSVFDPGLMDQDHLAADADRILVAQLTGEARHRARWRDLTDDEQAAAVTELRELAGGRSDLLAEVAGLFEGTSEGELNEPLARQAAELCRLAGADEAAIPQWVAEGRRRPRPHACRRMAADPYNRMRRISTAGDGP